MIINAEQLGTKKTCKLQAWKLPGRTGLQGGHPDDPVGGCMYCVLVEKKIIFEAKTQNVNVLAWNS